MFPSRFVGNAICSTISRSGEKSNLATKASTLPPRAVAPTDPLALVADILWHMTLPTVALVIILFGGYALIMRAAMLDVLTEDYISNSETGALESDNFNTYRVFSARDMPEIEVVLYEEPVPSGPFGAKGIAQGAMVAVTPSIANAIYDAIGVLITDMPATPEKILAALKKTRPIAERNLA